MFKIRGLGREELDQIYREEEMMKGNLCRMCVTDDEEELVSSYQYALKRLNVIYEINRQRFKSEVPENKE